VKYTDRFLIARLRAQLARAKARHDYLAAVLLEQRIARLVFA
jgi:hypothetical protein